MITIDADAHVVETEATWSYMDGADEKYRPILVTSRHEVPGVPPDISLEEMLRRPSFFVCDDQAFPTATVASRHYPSGAQFPSDIKARIRHLDELGIDVRFDQSMPSAHSYAPTTGGSPICAAATRIAFVGQS